MHKVKSSSTYSYRFKVGKFLPLIILQCNLQSKKKKSSHFCINLKTSSRSDIGSRASFCSTAELFTVARRTTNIRQLTQQVKTLCKSRNHTIISQLIIFLESQHKILNSAGIRQWEKWENNPITSVRQSVRTDTVLNPSFFKEQYFTLVLWSGSLR